VEDLVQAWPAEIRIDETHALSGLRKDHGEIGGCIGRHTRNGW
jgi:hypothetical protein